MCVAAALQSVRLYVSMEACYSGSMLRVFRRCESSNHSKVPYIHPPWCAAEMVSRDGAATNIHDWRIKFTSLFSSMCDNDETRLFPSVCRSEWESTVCPRFVTQSRCHRHGRISVNFPFNIRPPCVSLSCDSFTSVFCSEKMSTVHSCFYRQMFGCDWLLI